MLLIGGCELSLERNPVAKIENITLDVGTGNLVDEEIKTSEATNSSTLTAAIS